jgi:hypothetical protein
MRVYDDALQVELKQDIVGSRTLLSVWYRQGTNNRTVLQQ